MERELSILRLKLEIERVKSSYPEALTVGIADGALGNWEFLDTYTTRQVLDFYHASEYLTKAADAAFPGKAKERKTWLDDACHRLKHNKTGPKILIKEIEVFKNKRISSEAVNALINPTLFEHFGT